MISKGDKTNCNGVGQILWYCSLIPRPISWPLSHFLTSRPSPIFWPLSSSHFPRNFFHILSERGERRRVFFTGSLLKMGCEILWDTKRCLNRKRPEIEASYLWENPCRKVWMGLYIPCISALFLLEEGLLWLSLLWRRWSLYDPPSIQREIIYPTLPLLPPSPHIPHLIMWHYYHQRYPIPPWWRQYTISN